MQEEYSMEDLQNPEKLSEIIEDAKTQLSGTIEQQTRLLIEKRDKCNERGYHRVGSEPTDGEETMICYDCELWFDRNFAEFNDLKYKVVPL